MATASTKTRGRARGPSAAREVRQYVRAGARKDQLVAIALRLFGSRAYDDVQIEEIAREAGVAKGLLYHYFGSKRGLYVEAVRVAAGELLAALEPDPASSPQDNVRRGMLAYFGFVAARAEAYVALMRGGLQSDTDVRAIVDSIREAIVTRIAAGLGVDALPAAFRVAARSWIGGVEAAALDWLDHGDVGPEQLADLMAAGLLGMLLVASGQAPGSGARIDVGAGLRLFGSMMGAAPPR